MDLIANGKTVALTDEGFLINKNDWEEGIAVQLAGIDAIQLREEHWEILFFIRSYYEQYQFLPNTRQFIKAIAKTLGETKGNSRYLHQLFPSGPLKYACKLAGLPKPPTCL